MMIEKFPAVVRIEPQQIEGLRATPGFFTTLGVKAVRGRTFLPDEEKPGSAPVAVVSYP